MQINEQQRQAREEARRREQQQDAAWARPAPPPPHATLQRPWTAETQRITKQQEVRAVPLHCVCAANHVLLAMCATWYYVQTALVDARLCRPHRGDGKA